MEVTSLNISYKCDHCNTVQRIENNIIFTCKLCKRQICYSCVKEEFDLFNNKEFFCISCYTVRIKFRADLLKLQVLYTEAIEEMYNKMKEIARHKLDH